MWSVSVCKTCQLVVTNLGLKLFGKKIVNIVIVTNCTHLSCSPLIFISFHGSIAAVKVAMGVQLQVVFNGRPRDVKVMPAPDLHQFERRNWELHFPIKGTAPLKPMYFFSVSQVVLV